LERKKDPSRARGRWEAEGGTGGWGDKTTIAKEGVMKEKREGGGGKKRE